ncbi:MAG: amino acid carrier protein [Nannocystaceae bacterium]|nr:amino acid carrier protein [Nannocystaceae bacterium]
MAGVLARVADAVWSYPVVGLCLLAAVFFTFSLRLIQLRALPHAIALLLGRYDREDETGSISHLQALAAALSGTIGIGNIAGVAIAIAVGGPGAVLWMWVMGIFGMATKFVECTLGTAYREVDPCTGETRGGPMYYILAGLGPRWRPVALFYAATIALAGLGFTCMFQSNQAAQALRSSFAIPSYLTGAALAVLTGAVIVGGIRSIGRWAARIVPALCLVYVGGSIFICLSQIERMPAVLEIIVRDGLTGEAAAGGALGAMIMWGVRRAIFSNEAGLGSAAIAHAAVKTNEPVREGVVASLGPLIDTVIVSGATAFVIVLAGNYGAFKDEGMGQLQLVEVADAWQSVPSEQAPGEPTPLRERLDGVPVLGIDGRAAPADALSFEVPTSALEHDGIRIVAAVGSGGLEATLYSGGEVLGSLEFLSGSVVAAPLWRAQTLPFDAELRDLAQGQDLRLVVSPVAGAPSHRAFVATPTLVDERTGITLSSASFDRFIPGFGSVFISVAGFLFALSTMIAWSYYGETASIWVFGPRALMPYRIVFVALAFVGAVRKLQVVISISDILVGLLVVPNVIALLLLSPRVAKWSRDYFKRLAAGEFDESKRGR